MNYKNIRFFYIILFLLSPLFCYDSSTGKNITSRKNYKIEREKMVLLIKKFGIKDRGILEAMNKIPRHLFIPKRFKGLCNPYGNHPCLIGYGQTISQPYIVAYMTEKLKLKPEEKVLEIGTGSGYQAAVLAEIGCRVYTVERIKELADHSHNILKTEGYENVKTAFKNGFEGWSEFAPYDAVIVTCAPEKIPEKLINQLKDGGRMIIPVGKYSQRLLILRKKDGKIIIEGDLFVHFVPMKKDKN